MNSPLRTISVLFVLIVCTACAPQVAAPDPSPDAGDEPTDVSYDQNSWKDMIPESCTSYFDGCNTCRRAEGAEVAACTRKACFEYQKPECLEETVTMYVDSVRKDCVGVGPMQCLLTRTDESEDWQYFYDSISGFDYEEGFRYTLQVKKTKRENPPADANAYQYELIEVISKEAVTE